MKPAHDGAEIPAGGDESDDDGLPPISATERAAGVATGVLSRQQLGRKAEDEEAEGAPAHKSQTLPFESVDLTQIGSEAEPVFQAPRELTS